MLSVLNNPSAGICVPLPTLMVHGPIELFLVPTSAPPLVCGIVYVKDPLLLIEKSSQCSGSSRFPHKLTEWFITICPMPYTCKDKLKCVEYIIK